MVPVAMLRLTLAICAALALVLGAGWGARLHHDARRAQVASAALQQRAASIEAELRRWRQTDDDGPAAAATRTEALRTLRLLGELYAQEERLWTYYQALGASHRTRSELGAERAELERRIATHQRQLDDLDAALDRLRPPEDPGGISFTDP